MYNIGKATYTFQNKNTDNAKFFNRKKVTFPLTSLAYKQLSSRVKTSFIQILNENTLLIV